MSLDYTDELTAEELQEVLQLSESIKNSFPLIASQTCTGCSGSGYYDSDGSPKCGQCHGRGREAKKSDLVRKMANDLATIHEIDWEEAGELSKKIESHMKSIGLGWADEYYWVW